VHTEKCSARRQCKQGVPAVAQGHARLVTADTQAAARHAHPKRRESVRAASAAHARDLPAHRPERCARRSISPRSGRTRSPSTAAVLAGRGNPYRGDHRRVRRAGRRRAWLRAKNAFGAAGIRSSTRIAAVSVGLIDGEPRLDLMYDEDLRAETDMNVVVTGDGLVVEVTGTAEGKPSPCGARRDVDLASPAVPTDRDPESGARRLMKICSPAEPKKLESCGHPGARPAAGRRHRARRGAGYDEVPSRVHVSPRTHSSRRGGYRHAGCPRSPTTPGWPRRVNGMPGRAVRRWAGSHGDDETNLRLVLDR